MQLIHIIMNDGSRHFGNQPDSVSWYALRDHLTKLRGVVVTNFLTDEVTEVWIDFSYEAHSFTVNNQMGEYWFFVQDPQCPDEVLLAVLGHTGRICK